MPLLEFILFKTFSGATLSELSSVYYFVSFFYILKISGARAIASLNLQLSLAIVNNIKSILSDELLELLDLKISALMIKTENRNSHYNQYNDIKYSCKDEPSISYKFTSYESSTASYKNFQLNTTKLRIHEM